MSDIVNYPRVPRIITDRRESDRRHAEGINFLLQKTAELEDLVSTRVAWLGYYENTAQEGFLPNDMVQDDGWLMVCIKATDDRPAPQRSGSPINLREVPGTPPAFSKASVSTNILMTGQRITWPTASYALSVSFYVPLEDIGMEAEVWMVVDPLGDADWRQLVPNFIIDPSNDEEWIRIPQGVQVVQPNTTVDLILAVKPTVGSSSFTAEWDYKRDGGTPSQGQIYHAGGGNTDRMRVHQEDDDSVSWETELDNIGPGSTIFMASTGYEWEVISASKITGSVYEFIVTPASRAQEDKSFFTFTYFATNPVWYDYVTDWYAGQANVNGFLMDNGYDPNITLNNNLYGVDVELQEITLSSDWEVMAKS